MDLLIEGLILLVVVVIGWSIIKFIVSKAAKILLNSVAGMMILLVLNIVLQWKIPINATTLIVCGLFGLPGVATLIILHIAAMI